MHFSDALHILVTLDRVPEAAARLGLSAVDSDPGKVVTYGRGTAGEVTVARNDRGFYFIR